MTAPFVDHLQILPMPHKDGRRQADGAYRPGGLGMSAIADRLEERGWTPRVEDLGFDKPLKELRLAESFARSLGDAVASAWDRNRFPVLLLRSSYGALGPIDALGERTGVAWIAARPGYGTPGLFRRTPLDRCALSLVTGRVERDRFAVRPVRLPGSRILVVGGWGAGRDEREALAAASARIVGLEGLASTVAGTDADTWYLHVDLGALRGAAVPAADEPGADGFDPHDLARAIDQALRGRGLKAAAFARYDLNRDVDGRTLATLIELIESAVLAAGGAPSPVGGQALR